MNNMLAYCGLDCTKCDAYIATKNNDQALREKTARLWSELNNAPILPEHINCDGCRANGRKTVFCESMCQIRQCALKKGVETCADCSEIDCCSTLNAVTANSPDALKNLKTVKETDPQPKALVVIDIQNDITKHYHDIISNVNSAIDWALSKGMHIVYIKHNNLSTGTRTFKPNSKGEELVPELKVVSDHIFVKTKANALTSNDFAAYIATNGLTEFYIVGADATACVKSTCFNMRKAGYTVHVISDCVTSYDLTKPPEMLAYYAKQGCEIKTLSETI